MRPGISRRDQQSRKAIRYRAAAYVKRRNEQTAFLAKFSEQFLADL
jgi:hypothetical protein